MPEERRRRRQLPSQATLSHHRCYPNRLSILICFSQVGNSQLLLNPLSNAFLGLDPSAIPWSWSRMQTAVH